jgi:hypothetical protein
MIVTDEPFALTEIVVYEVLEGLVRNVVEVARYLLIGGSAIRNACKSLIT